MSFKINDLKISFWIIKYRILILFFIILICIASLFLIPRLRIGAKVSDTFPSNHPYVFVQEKINKTFGGVNRVNIAIERKNGNILSKETLTKIRNISEDLFLLDDVNPHSLVSLSSKRIKNVEVKPDGFFVKPLMRHIPETEEELQALKEKIIRNPMVYGPLVSKGFKASMIQIAFKDNCPSKKIYSAVMDIIQRQKDENHNIYASGKPILDGYIESRMPQILYPFLGTFIILIIFLGIVFRQIRGILLPIISGLVSLILTLGSIALFHFTITPFTILIPFLIFILAVSHSIQFINRYFEETVRGKDKLESIGRRVLFSLLNPIRASLFTDFLGFFSLCLIPIPAIQKMGLTGSAGILSIFISVVALLPICFTLLPPPKNIVGKYSSSLVFGNKALSSIATGLLKPKYKYPVLLLFVFVFAFSFYELSNIKVGEVEAGTSMLYKKAPYNRAEQAMNKYFSGSSPYFVLVQGRYEDALVKAEVFKEIDSLQQYLKKNLSQAGYSLSISNYLKLMNMAVNGKRADYVIPPLDRTNAEYLFLLEASSFPGVFNEIIDPEHRHANIRIDMKDCKAESIDNIIKTTNDWIIKHHKSKDVDFLYAGGLIGMLGATNDVIKKSIWQSMIILSVLIFIRLILALRSFKGGIILFIPLLFSLAITFGSFAVFNIPFTISSLPVASMGTGLGIDYAIYLASRIKEEISLNNSLVDALKKGILTSGRAVFITGTIVSVGLFSWVIAPLKLQAQLGVTLGLLLVVNMLTALIVLPVLFYVFKPNLIQRS